MESERKKRVTTTQTTFALIEAIREFETVSLSELARHTGLAKSTVHRHVTTLLDDEYLVREGNEYRLSFRFLNLGEHVRNQNPIHVMAKPKVEQIAAETGERAQFLVEEHGYGVYLHFELGEHAVRTDSALGKRVPMNAISAGKAILSAMPERRVQAIIERNGLPQLTEHTITDEDELFADLERTRERGYAVNIEESTYGLSALAVPVKGKDHEVIGAFGVSGPTHRFKGPRFEQELPDLLLGVVNQFELDIQYQS